MNVTVDPAVLSAVLLAGVDHFAVAHNHSAGDVRPTTIDVDLTAKLMDAANTVGLYFEDHLVLSPRGKAFSFASSARQSKASRQWASSSRR